MVNSSNYGLGRPFLVTAFKFIPPFIGTFSTMGGMSWSVKGKVLKIFFVYWKDIRKRLNPTTNNQSVFTHTGHLNLGFFPNNFTFRHWLILQFWTLKSFCIFNFATLKIIAGNIFSASLGPWVSLTENAIYVNG